MNRIKELRRLRGVDAKSLAAKTKVPPDVIADLESGKSVLVTTQAWNALSDFFGVPEEYLMGYADDWDSDRQREVFRSRMARENWSSNMELRGFSRDEWREDKPAPAWIYENMNYFKPYFVWD